MTPTICGHERHILVWACRFVDSHEVGHCRKWEHGEHDAALAVYDPAKLAELLAEALRERGVTVLRFRENYDMPFLCVGIFPPSRTPIRVQFWGRFMRTVEYDAAWFSMPQARSALLHILELPQNATADDTVKALSNAS
jgi:hypothetical protein